MTAGALRAKNAKLSLENDLLKKRSELLDVKMQNSLSSLSAGIMSGVGGQSNLTSFNPALQNNIYAPLTINYLLLMYMYKTHGIIQTAIDMPVLDALRGGLELFSDDLDEDDLSQVEDALETNGIYEAVSDAFIWARLFGGGALIVNTDAGYDTPLNQDRFDGRLEFYDATRWELGSEQRIPASGFYQFYGHQIHQSRVLTILGKRAPWLIRFQLADWGMSEIERLLEDFNNYLRNRNVIYELLNEAKIDVYRLKGLRTQLMTSGGTAATQRRVQTMNEIKSYQNALLMDTEDEYEQKQVTFAGLAEMMAENRHGVASALRMPVSKIFGMQSAGFSSGEDDIENYNALVESEVRTPMRLVWRKVLNLVVENLFGAKLDINFKYRPMRTLSATDEEIVKKSKSDRYLAMFDHMLMSSKEVGDAMHKDGIIPISTAAQEGLLDEHPVMQPPPLSQVSGAAESGEEQLPGLETKKNSKRSKRR